MRKYLGTLLSTPSTQSYVMIHNIYLYRMVPQEHLMILLNVEQCK